MIKINKKEKPQILKDYAQQWTTEYLSALQQQKPVPNYIKYR